MTPAAKTVTVRTVQHQAATVPLGRVYVKDPDGWHSTSKSYSWASTHPGFSLNTSTGHLTMEPETPQGRYELGFKVSDASQGQVGVRANVTVEVTPLSPRDVSHATPLTLAADPYRVVKEEEEGTSVLRQLVAAARAWVGGGGAGLRVVTVQPLQGPTTRVWLVSPGITSLHHILLHRKEELSHMLGVSVQDVGVGACNETTHEATDCVGGCLARPVLGHGYSLVDGSTSAMVGPVVDIASECGCGRSAPSALLTTCSPSTCLNGGRCLPTSTSTRCICPYGTWGSRCKILTRHFEGGGGRKGTEGHLGDDESDPVGGWAWLTSIPPCPEIHISLEVLTSSEDATLLYSGPDHLAPPPPPGDVASDVILLELRGGRPSLLLDLGGGPVTLTLLHSYSFADSTWHRIDLIWKDELVEMIVDLCSGGSIDGPRVPRNRSAQNTSTPPKPPPPIPPDAHTCRGAARLPRAARVLNTPQPLQVGGLAHPPPAHTVYGWPEPLRSRSLRGCIRNLRVNRELMDLGSGVLSLYSSPGCPAVDCSSSGLHCGIHARCQGSPGFLRCECQPGWTGPGCATPTTPTSFHLNSFVKLALSFTPLGYTTSISLRFRTWQSRGDLVVLSSMDGRDRFGVQLVGGRACVLLQLHPDPARSLCLTQARLTDGRWHHLAATRHGSATFLTADDGDRDFYNASVSLEGRQLLDVDRQEGVHMGGSPESVGLSLVSMEGDFHDGCVDDVRISGQGVPLPPVVNSTAWGQDSVMKGVEQGCRAPPACANVTCRAPLSCIDTWRSYHCGCGEGRVLNEVRSTCEDIDECEWAPCLHGGTCLNMMPGYVCSCPSGFSGRHCHLPDVGDTSLKLSLAALVAIVVWCTFLFLLICAFLLHQHHRRSALRRGMADGKETSVSCKEQVTPPCSHTPNLLELQLLKLPKANGQPACTKNPNIADVDVLQVDATSVTSSLEEQKRSSTTPTSPDANHDASRREEKRKRGNRSDDASRGGSSNPPAGDDLRNYAYEGEGSSPGSLSSCLESCSGSAKFLGGFREVAHILES